MAANGSQKETLNSSVPDGPIAEKWTNHKNSSKLINPANKRKYSIIVVGSGLAGGAAAATILGRKSRRQCLAALPHGPPYGMA